MDAPEPISAARIERDNFLGARRALFAAMAAEMRRGRQVTDIARDVAGALSHPVALDHLRSIRIRDKARALLRGMGGGQWFGVSYRDDGDDRLRQRVDGRGVRMAMSFDPTCHEPGADGPAIALRLAQAAVDLLTGAGLTVARTDKEYETAAAALADGEVVLLTAPGRAAV